MFLIGLISSSWASLYNCSSPNSKPIRNQESTKNELLISNVSPLFTSNELNRENLENKAPFLIYYAIDSAEAFMQYSVRFEIAKLQESCRKNTKVQFVAFLNSLYVESNTFILCKDQKVSEINLKEFPELNKTLAIKRKFITTGNHTDDETGPLRYLVKYFKETNKPFGRYPLAHPDFLYDLVNLATTDKNLFPNEKYSAFINLKSHGSEDNVLAGMHSCQEKAKELSSKKIIENILPKNEIKFLKKNESINSIEENIIEYEKIISKIDLGSSRGVGSFNKDPKLGENRLGENRLDITGTGLGSAFTGLGVNEGLGADYAFGTIQVALGWVLDDLFKAGSDRSLAFMMLESCETNRDPEFFHAYLNNIFGYYTAKKSLWYRNLNWWEILEKADGTTVKVLEILREETPKIPNIEVVNK